MTDKLCILICENLKREARQVIEAEEYADVDVHTIAACCGCPETGWSSVNEVARAHAKDYDKVCVLSGKCVVGLGAPTEIMNNCYFHEMEQCFELFISKSIVDKYICGGAYLMVPGWVENWEKNLERCGFDHHTAPQFFGESVQKLVLLDTGVSDTATPRVQEFADFVGLHYEIVPVGLDFFRLLLTKIVMEWRLRKEKQASLTALAGAKRELSDYMMVFDLISNLTGVMDEEKVIERILELFNMICAPRSVVYMQWGAGASGDVKALLQDGKPRDTAAIQKRLGELQSDYAWTPSGAGFALRITYNEELLGILEVEEIAFPEYKEHYLNLALSVVHVFGLAISNARAYQQVKQAEHELAQRAQELARSNEELQRFAYISSHDLQEPLRMVTSYTQLLARRYKGKLDEDADEFISYAVEGATRMSMLIKDLLAYSRVGTHGHEFVRTDCEVVLAHVLANLRILIEENGAVITHDPLPVVRGDGIQLEQLFQNLIANALKFRREVPPRVHISAKRQGNEWRFAVQDNGIGIAQEYAERIFVVFQRLHSRKEYAGTGIGLAICKRIVERHGGRIWVESEPGRGSIFYFTLHGNKSTTKNTKVFVE